MSGIRAGGIDRQRRKVLLEDGRRLDYEILVLATGSAARIPPALAPFRPQFHTLNSLEDLMTLRRRRQQALERKARPRWAIIGGGLIGCEVASDLEKAGDAVTIFHRERRLLEVVLDEQTGLATARGIVVNRRLRTADAAIYAVGDVAEIEGRLYPFVSPIRSQALWLAAHIAQRNFEPWKPPAFSPIAKIHGFKPPLPHAPETPSGLRLDRGHPAERHPVHAVRVSDGR